MNRLAIVKAILLHGPVARSDLPGLTHLSAGLITQQTQAMVKSGLVTETRDDKSRKGRPRLLLELNDSGPVVVGASIDGRGNLMTTFVSLSGTKLFETSGHYTNPRSLADLAQHLGNTLAAAITESGFAKSRIARIGIALPALIDSRKGEIHNGSTFRVEPTPFAAPIAKIVGVPVTIENEMDCMARAEHWFGIARGIDDFSLVRVGLSIDAAQFANGVPLSGSNGLSSSFGHIKVEPNEIGAPCFCGGRGCLTAYASMYGILQSQDRLSGLSFPPLDQLPGKFSELLVDALGGRDDAAAAIEKARTLFTMAIGNLLSMTSASDLFIAVDDQRYLDLLASPFQGMLEKYVLPGILPRTKVKFFKSNDDWRWKGTAALALEQLYLDDSRNFTLAKRRRKMEVVND